MHQIIEIIRVQVPAGIPVRPKILPGPVSDLRKQVQVLPVGLTCGSVGRYLSQVTCTDLDP